MDFEILQKIKINKDNEYETYEFVIFRETTTDVLWVSHEGNLVEMTDPQTGLPLTFKQWQTNYKK